MAQSNILIYYSPQPPAQSPFRPMAGGRARESGLVRGPVPGQTPVAGQSCAGRSLGGRSEWPGSGGAGADVDVCVCVCCDGAAL